MANLGTGHVPITVYADNCCGVKPLYLISYHPCSKYKLRCSECDRIVKDFDEAKCVERWNDGVKKPEETNESEGKD